MKRCFACGGVVQDVATACLHCGEALDGTGPVRPTTRGGYEVERDVARIEAERRRALDLLASARRNRTAGAAALLIGLLGLLFFFGWWPLWLFLAAIGALTLITALANEAAAGRELALVEAQWAAARGRAAGGVES